MNAVLDERVNAREYSVIGFACQDSAERPSLAAADKPHGISEAHWTQLKTLIYQGHIIWGKLFGLLCFGIAAILLIAISPHHRQNGQQDDDDQAFRQVLILTIVALSFFTRVLFYGAWQAQRVRQAVATMQPVLQQVGWNLSLTTTPSIFCLGGYITLQPRLYQSPALPDMA